LHKFFKIYKVPQKRKAPLNLGKIQQDKARNTENLRTPAQPVTPMLKRCLRYQKFRSAYIPPRYLAPVFFSNEIDIGYWFFILS